MLDKLESNRNIRTFASFCLKRVQLLFKVKNLLRQLGNKIRKPAITGSRWKLQERENEKQTNRAIEVTKEIIREENR